MDFWGRQFRIIKFLNGLFELDIMTTASAPGKVILFREHAVVYDKLGIASTVDRRCFITVSTGKEGVFRARAVNSLRMIG